MAFVFPCSPVAGKGMKSNKKGVSWDICLFIFTYWPEEDYQGRRARHVHLNSVPEFPRCGFGTTKCRNRVEPCDRLDMLKHRPWPRGLGVPVIFKNPQTRSCPSICHVLRTMYDRDRQQVHCKQNSPGGEAQSSP